MSGQSVLRAPCGPQPLVGCSTEDAYAVVRQVLTFDNESVTLSLDGNNLIGSIKLFDAAAANADLLSMAPAVDLTVSFGADLTGNLAAVNLLMRNQQNESSALRSHFLAQKSFAEFVGSQFQYPGPGPVDVAIKRTRVFNAYDFEGEEAWLYFRFDSIGGLPISTQSINASINGTLAFTYLA